MSTQTETVVDRPSAAPSLDDGSGDPEHLAHIVNQHLPGNSVTDAMIEGVEVVALCGHRFIPYRRAEEFPVCKACRDALAATT